jgi:hypothetical protein
MRNLFKLFIVLLLTLVGILGFGGLANAAACVPQDAVATTYKTVENPDYVPAVEEESHTITVVDEEAYDEEVLVTAQSVIHHEAVPPTVTHFPAVTHVVHHEATYTTVHHPEVFHVEYKYLQWVTFNVKWRDTPSWNGYPADADWGWFYTGDSRIVIDEPAWDEQVLDQAAYDEIVVDSEAYDVTNDDGVDAYDEIVPAVYTTVHHEAVTHEETVIDVEAADAIGDPTIEVVDVEGTDAVVCEPVVVTPVVAPVVAAPVVAAPVAVIADPVYTSTSDELAHTGSAWDNIAPYALAFLMLGIALVSATVLGRRYDKRHHQQL